ncbi:hypothetical protein SAMN05421636_10812 [Pricia antarctica]|uniref:Uncharacterized protein n=1 Tax=Pricia antarctica TaxID=641691 RepID=A0A1G7G825_9FLAO|nr:hypothetical protein [Pricia antarctica]SDE84270.1 hypothetical protein SAMN05421636_10812 [Pricia antarctica]
MQTLSQFNPSPELMKKVYWTNRYSDRIMKLHDEAHAAFMKESEHWGSEKHLLSQQLNRRIAFRVNVLARYSSLLTTAALKFK